MTQDTPAPEPCEITRLVDLVDNVEKRSPADTAGFIFQRLQTRLAIEIAQLLAALLPAGLLTALLAKR